ncbi:hypothetical protein DK26_15260 [Bosea sp. WAO]|uniref:hypothetical protein n=1 Tax=Bosea sp. WAO TaxID=406341 RepID=UPI000748A863|nr:hypothetical protein [Bosea sp. WAO]KUL94363.1 hypothetical protein DK26_15260 [Bosea sp. WAO]
MGDTKPVARFLREAAFYRDIADKAVRLRRIGQQADRCEDALRELHEANPDMTKSLTMPLMMNQAFTTAMEAFDKAVQDAALAGVTFDEIEPPKPQDTRP